MRAWMLFLSLAACVEEAAQEEVFASVNPPEGDALDVLEQAPPPAVMSLTVAALVPGRHAVFDLWGGGATTSGRVLTGSSPGQTCPPVLGGACLGLANLRTVAAYQTNLYGSAEVSVLVPAAFAAPAVWLQAGSLAPALSPVVMQATTRVGASYAVGNVDLMPQATTFSAGYLLGERVLVPDRVTLEGFGVRASVAGPTGQLALYTDVGGAPRRLVAQSSAMVISGGLQVERATSPVVLAPGEYWLMAVWDVQLDGFQAPNPGRLVSYTNHVAGAPLPNPFPLAPQTYDGGGFNYFLQVH